MTPSVCTTIQTVDPHSHTTDFSRTREIRPRRVGRRRRIPSRNAAAIVLGMGCGPLPTVMKLAHPLLLSARERLC